MSTTDKSLLTKFLTGGDLMFHRLQLFIANSLRLLIVGAVVFVGSSWAMIYFFVNKYEWYVFYKTMLARFWSFVHLPNYHLDFIRPDGVLIDSTTSAAIVKFVTGTPELAGYIHHIFWFLSVAGFIAAFAAMANEASMGFRSPNAAAGISTTL